MSFPLRSNPLESNALSQPFLPRLRALLEGFFRDPLQLRPHGHLDVVHVFKTSSVDEPPELGEEEKITWRQVRVSREIAPARRCSSQPGTVGCSGHPGNSLSNITTKGQKHIAYESSVLGMIDCSFIRPVPNSCH